MQFLSVPRKRSLSIHLGAIFLLCLMLAACGGSSSSNSVGIHGNCVAGSNTKEVPLTKAHKVAWSQNALDGAWRFAEEASIESQAAAHGYQLLKTNANNSDDQQVQDIENLINDRPDVLLVDPHTEDAE